MEKLQSFNFYESGLATPDMFLDRENKQLIAEFDSNMQTESIKINLNDDTLDALVKCVNMRKVYFDDPETLALREKDFISRKEYLETCEMIDLFFKDFKYSHEEGIFAPMRSIWKKKNDSK